MRLGENALAGEFAAPGVVIERPDPVTRAVGEIHGATVGAPGEAVRHLDAGAERAAGAIALDAVEHALRRGIRGGQRAGPEEAGAGAAPAREAPCRGRLRPP